MSYECYVQSGPSLNQGQTAAAMGRDTVLPCSPSDPLQQTSEAAETAETAEDPRLLTFRVTGAASVARLEPLLLSHDQESRRKTVWCRAGSRAGDEGENDPRAAARLDFVWETTVTKEQQEQHRAARVLNRLSGAQVRLLYRYSAPKHTKALALHFSVLGKFTAAPSREPLTGVSTKPNPDYWPLSAPW